MLCSTAEAQNRPDSVIASKPCLLAGTGEPLADGQVVELQAGPGQSDRHDEYRDADEDMRAERRIGIARSPCHLHIDQRIMRDIKRIGYFAEEFADGDGFGIRDAASGTHRDDQREDEQDHQRLIDAVEPRCRGIADMGHDQRRRNEQRTPPESAPHPDQCPEAREQQSREEGVQQAREALKKLEQTQAAYNHALGVLYLDATTAAPSDTWEGRGKTMEVMSQITYDLLVNDENDELLSYLEAHADELDAQTKREVEVLRKSYDQIHRIPAEEYVAYSVLINDAESVWHKAKPEDDFAAFAPYLEKIVDYNRKFAGYYHPEMAPYDALLNEYEEGMNVETLDAFFAQLRQTIVPLIEKIRATKQIDDAFLYRHYPVEIQRKLSDYLMEVMGIDRTHCGIAETEHPFTTNFNNKDVRITTHYFEDNLVSSMFSVIHEGGHALYELGADDCYNYTALAGGVSMGIHESQSRFYENIIGRSPAYVHAVFPKLKELFPEQLADVDEEMFYRAINKAEPSLIRTEADELTYSLHIMVRYEIEKQLIGGTLAVKDVPAEWKRLYKQYLGVDVPSDREGCLQDSHWSGGSIGYFPSYALGSAYGAQMLHKMQEEIGDIWPDVAKGDLSKVTDWLRSHIHRYASFKKPGELFESVCGKFDAKYYTDYLTEKYTKLYGL